MSETQKNVLGTDLEVCGTDPVTGFFETDAATPALVTLGPIPSARLWMISSLSSPRAKGMIWLHPDQSMGSKV